MEEEVSAQPPLPVASELPPSPMDDQEQQRKAESLPVDARDRGGADQDEDRNSKEVQATSTRYFMNAYIFVSPSKPDYCCIVEYAMHVHISAVS